MCVAVLTVCNVTFLFDILTPNGTFERIAVRDGPGIIITFFVTVKGDFRFLSRSVGVTRVLVLVLLDPALIGTTDDSEFGFSRP